ncbi:hypothetical protein [Blastococcus sp. URHD0036]|uniref:hypothetical protein n=1 Tax=Blastococcus sp. URHD0036 TaxID=1380356 RepID=UPI0012DE9DE0|nr:hypothetical protein [Blastococcus sp. URHD0036]
MSPPTDDPREQSHEPVEHPHGHGLADADPVGGLVEEPKARPQVAREEEQQRA